jgi:hypothetical protein
MKQRVLDLINELHPQGLTFYTGGHGWLKVDKCVLDVLGIHSEISKSSKQRGGCVFLEEDCDAPMFIQKLKDLGIKVGDEIMINEDLSDSSDIREYLPYR